MFNLTRRGRCRDISSSFSIRCQRHKKLKMSPDLHQCALSIHISAVPSFLVSTLPYQLFTFPDQLAVVQYRLLLLRNQITSPLPYSYQLSTLLNQLSTLPNQFFILQQHLPTLLYQQLFSSSSASTDALHTSTSAFHTSRSACNGTISAPSTSKSDHQSFAIFLSALHSSKSALHVS